MSNRYVVWSRITVDDVAKEVIEVSRSDRKVAEDDAALIRDVLHRNAWVQDTEEK
jgi:hypothetical protein